MIITRTPLRMSFLGGGSDLPAFYKKEKGAVLSTSINKYMYINLHSKFDDGIRLAYSRVEEVKSVNDIEHPIVRNILKYFAITGGLEISSIADIPARGTGLGSSSSYAVGLIKAISEYKGVLLSKAEIAEIACEVEINMCGEPIGKQDQFAASFGGFNIFEFSSDGVNVKPIRLSSSFIHQMSASLVAVYTGQSRSASLILKEQKKALDDDSIFNLQKQMVDLVYEGEKLLLAEDLQSFGQLLDESWRMKRQLTDSISNTVIDDIYATGMRAGAWGGKLLGAGMGGFVMFLVNPINVNSVKSALSNYRFVDLYPDASGSVTIYSSKGEYHV